MIILSFSPIESVIQVQREIFQTNIYKLHPNYQHDGLNPFPAQQSTKHKIEVYLNLKSSKVL